MSDVDATLRCLEPIFHRLPRGCSKGDVSAIIAADYWEVGASGNVYDRDHCINVVASRYADPAYDPMDGLTVADFAARRLDTETWLVTYRLAQDDRVTRRATIWRREPQGWVAQYHQGTEVC